MDRLMADRITHHSGPEWRLHAFRLQSHPIDIPEEWVIQNCLFATLVGDAAESSVDVLGHELAGAGVFRRDVRSVCGGDFVKEQKLVHKDDDRSLV
jgi:hypothetical protein